MKMKRMLILGLLTCAFLTATAISVLAATVTPWPDTPGTDYSWYAYSTDDGSLIYDPADQSPASTDLISVPGVHPSVYVASDGTNIFFRMRLRGDPMQAPRFSSYCWIVEIAARDAGGNFSHTATVGLQGGNPSHIYVAPSYGTNLTYVYSNVTTSSNSVRVMPTNDGYSHFFLDFQVPIDAINKISGQYGRPLITGSTPVKFFYGTSTNPVHIGKDYMTGSAVSFDKMAIVELANIEGYLAPELEVQKMAPASIAAGTKITYQLTVTNKGPGNAINVVIADAIPSSITNAEYSLNNGNSWQPWNGTRTLPIFLADPGINNILIRGDVKSNASGTITNTVIVTSDSSPTVSAQALTSVTASSDLSVTKRALTQAKANERMEYLINVYNNGPSDASDVVITDIFDSAEFESAEYFNMQTLIWEPFTGSVNIGTLKSNESFQLEIRADLSAGVSESVTTTAQVASSSLDPYLGNNTYTTITPLNAAVDLAVVKQAPDTIVAGQEIDYTVVVSNIGTTDATNVQIEDYISPLISNVEYSLDGSAWDDWNGIKNIGTIGAGQDAVLILKGNVLSGASGIIENTVFAYSDLPDSNIEDNIDFVETEIIRQSDLEVVKIALTKQEDIIAGHIIEYEITYRNNGPSDADNVIITDNVSSSIVMVEASRCRSAFLPWRSPFNAGTVVAGGECTIVIRGVVLSSFLGELTNTASLSSGSIELYIANDVSTIVNTVRDEADLMITKSVSSSVASPGDTLVYTITVDNLSLSDARDVIVEEILPETLIIVETKASHGQWQSPKWQIGYLEKGETATLEIITTVSESAYNQSIINAVRVSSSTHDPVASNNQASTQTNTTLPKTGQSSTLLYVLIGLALTAAAAAATLFYKRQSAGV